MSADRMAGRINLGRLALVLALLTGGLVSAAGSGQTYEILHTFNGADGSGPWELVQASDGDFYGTTASGGVDNAGTSFKLSAGGLFTTLHFFNRESGGRTPSGGLVQASDGNFYGTTINGSDPASNGSVFRMDRDGVVEDLHSFSGQDGLGWQPWGGVIQASDGDFYGTTYGGGTWGIGTVFRMTSSGAFTMLHSISSEEGESIYGRLVQGSDGHFYGTTFSGAAVFRITSSGSWTILHANESGGEFDGSSGALIEGTDGNFYGTTEGGENGNVYKITPDGELTFLHSFSGTDGREPYAGLVQASDSRFYGTTQYGGAGAVGTIFRLEPSGAFTTLHSFALTDGAYPRAALIEARDGYLYGTTGWGGGAAGEGVIFRIAIGESATAVGNQSVTVSTAPEMTGFAGTTATLTNGGGGTPTVTVQNFPGDPGTSGIINVGGKYVDLKVTGADLSDSVTANFYYPSTIIGGHEITLRLYYFTGSSWELVHSADMEPTKNTMDNLDATVSGGRFTAVFDATSFPKITELTGTIFTFSIAVSYNTCLLYDPSRAHRSGSTVPIKFQLCDENGRNLSAADVVVTALGISLVSGEASGPVEDSGNANPDSNFRYDPSLGDSGGYIYNLNTRGLATGTYAVHFMAGADQIVHTAQFQVR